jgi:hypothetical protein
LIAINSIDLQIVSLGSESNGDSMALSVLSALAQRPE